MPEELLAFKTRGYLIPKHQTTPEIERKRPLEHQTTPKNERRTSPNYQTTIEIKIRQSFREY